MSVFSSKHVMRELMVETCKRNESSKVQPEGGYISYPPSTMGIMQTLLKVLFLTHSVYIPQAFEVSLFQSYALCQLAAAIKS